MSLRRSALFALLLVVLDPACSADSVTQLVVVVDSDWDGFDRIAIQIDDFAQPATADAKLSDKHLPRRVVLVHEGGPLGPLGVTVRAFVAGASDPVLTESRTAIFFEEDKTRALTIELLFQCIGSCALGQACVAGPKCVASDSLSKLEPWTGGVQALPTAHRVDAGDVIDKRVRDAASRPAAVDGGPPVRADAAVSSPDSGFRSPAFTYVPTNFDPTVGAIAALDRADVKLGCGKSEFNSTDLQFVNWCGPKPQAIAVEQRDGTDAAVIVMASLNISSGASLQLTGSRPVILAVFGDVRIDGTLDASAHAATAGPGADRACDGGAGSSGANGSGGTAGGGGSGAGFGSAGGAGGGGDLAATVVSGGTVVGSATLSPLRGGCSGGRGGNAGSGTPVVASAGGGGGAVQVSAAGRLIVAGTVSAAGGGGGIGSSAQLGGGGGGSGGGVLLEAQPIEIQGSAVISANGGSGGAGQPAGFSAPNSKPGADGSTGVTAAAGGMGTSGGGMGGAGAAFAGEAQSGGNGATFQLPYGAGGGGGGGVGRIRVNQATNCALRAVLSPWPSVACPSCVTCPSAPSLGCQALERDTRIYYRCDLPLTEQNARNRCRNAELDLVQINDSAENAWLHSQVTDERWLGASDAAQEGTWLWLRDGVTFWLAASGPVMGAFAGWAPNEPNNASGPVLNADCATIGADGLWRDRGCDVSYPYVCE